MSEEKRQEISQETAQFMEEAYQAGMSMSEEDREAFKAFLRRLLEIEGTV